MRAFMSRRDERDERTADAGTMGDLGVAWLAEREARAILAETEPATYHTRQCPLAELPAEAWERLGLAEALAAFVEG